MIRLVETCSFAPEQYDAFDGEEQVGYLRLRHGYFAVRCPDAGDESPVVFDADTVGGGSFLDEVERDKNLRQAVAAILKWRGERADPETVEFEIERLGD